MKKLGLLVVVALAFVGCGGGGSSDSSATYDMWDYIASSSSKTLTFVTYSSESTFSTWSNKSSDTSYVRYMNVSETEKQYSDSDGTVVTFTLNGSSISIAGTSIARNVSIGSKVGECTVSQFYSEKTFVDDQTFENVLEFNCGNYKQFYAEGKGNVVNYTVSTFDRGSTVYTSYGIAVVNNW